MLHAIRFPLVTLALLVVPTLSVSVSDDAIPNDPPARWWKGNIHTHSFWSDGNDFPEMISEWYRTHHYNFLAISDHNVLAQGQRWMKKSLVIERGGDAALSKYLDRFGPAWVEMRPALSEGDASQDTQPKPDEPELEIRLKPFNEYRSLLEERGRFILLQGEEISASVDDKPIHLNATNIHNTVLPINDTSVVATIESNLRAVEVQARELGREILVHLNHPNFGYAITAEELAQVVSERFFEVYNGHKGVNQKGDPTHPAVESMWDVANTLRLAQYDVAPLMGVATDDSHHYHGGPNSPGRGWIMVRAHHLSPESLIRAMKRGDFYASTGVTLTEVDFDEQLQKLSVTVAAEESVTYEVRFIGTRKPAKKDGPISPDQVGVTLKTAPGPVASYTFNGDELYVRATIISSRPHPNPSLPNQFESAWTQPVGWQALPINK